MIDTETFPPEVLDIRGDAELIEMVRIAVRPSWVGLIDFESRLPSALGGVTA